MNDYELWFAIANLSYRTKRKLLENFKNIQNLWYRSVVNEKSNELDINTLKILKKAWNKEKIDFIKNEIEKNEINTVVITEQLYPKRLKIYDDAPYMLFYKGNIEKLNQKYNVSIVGSRKCTNYGINVSNIISESLCKNNINIISGMARGIDSIVHQKCIAKISYTCAVLGSGLDIVYPKDNLRLYNEILHHNGCIISQFIPGTKPYSYNFPIRNKIISGLSDLVIVVEAGKKSGSLITASAALEQGKDVIAVPGNIFSSQSVGTNHLIKDGAYVLTNIEDIYELLHINNIKENLVKQMKMSNIEQRVYKYINTNPIHIDDISRLTNIDIKKLYEVLLNLQLNEEIVSLSGNYYVKNVKEI
ncbi:DNA-processing protein DprA [Clostridium ganghwense]|uniref:DNA-processing protein DprA n=1 Tax=Clostridium ganghwense TaxID=312089 RepID=A0ABT4CTU9_9CLOT|nr:DNA-processing protein DprA [Clostridium ganghwense]MCY6372500.1 DNA-processing protein DprA [Clostridium ganghwense]